MATRDWLLIVALGAIWGFSFIFNAVLIREIGPFWVSALRVSIGAAGCWAFLLILGKPVPGNPKLLVQMGLLGVLSYAIPFALFPLSQAHLASGIAAIINAMTPIMTVLIAFLVFGGEKATRGKAIGILLGFSGALILAWPSISQGGESHLWAIGACLAATVCYAFALNIARSFAAVDPTVIATISLTGAAVAALPVAFLTEGTPTMTRPETFGAALAIGLISTALTFQIMYRILPRVGATNFSVTTFIAPISALAFGAMLLGEQVGLLHLLGMAVIFAGLLMLDGRVFARFRRMPIDG